MASTWQTKPLIKTIPTSDIMTTSYSLFVVFGFIAVVLLMEGVYVWWSDTRSPEVQRIQKRLRVLNVGESRVAGDMTLLKQRLLSTKPELQRLLMQVPKIYQLDRLLLQAGSTLSVMHFCSICVIAACGGFLFATLLVLPWQGSLLMMAVFIFIPVLWLIRQRSKRIEKFNAQLPDAMDLISRSLRAGHSFSSALAMVGNESQEPISGEFKIVFDEISFGISTQNALLNLTARVPLPDVRYFVMAVIIQLETGGNLAELLNMLGQLIRQRYKLFGKIRVLAAEGKLSAMILVALPFVVAGALQALNPGYMNGLLLDPMGMKLIVGALALMVVGVLVMWRIVKIHI
jgi:tight adherence protein B